MKQLLLLLVFLFPVSAVAQVRYYLGPWVWQTETLDSETGAMVPDPAWTPPPGTISAIDLRTLPQQGSPGPIAQGVGLFAVNRTLGSAYTLLGQGNPDSISVSNGARNAWQLATGYSPAGATLSAALWDQLTNGSDPAGATGPKPLMPTPDGRLELHLGGGVRTERFRFGVSPHTAKVEAVHQRDYRAVVQDAIAGLVAADLPGKVLDALAEKYGLNKADESSWMRLVPPDLRSGAALVPHQTTITEDFDCADSDNPDCDLDWTEVATDIDIVSNKAQSPSGAGLIPAARAESDLSSVDHHSQAVLATGSSSSSRAAGPAARFDSSDKTFYWARQAAGASSNGILRPYKVVTGTATALGTGTTQTINGTKKVGISGSTLDVYHNGSSVESITDTAITTGTRTGIAFDNTSNTFTLDDFEAADLAGAATYNPTAGQTLVIQ